MNKQTQKELSYVQDCIEGRLSVQKLCEKLKVSHPGLGSRIIKLKRLEVAEKHNEE